jgi:hypothetical protein
MRRHIRKGESTMNVDPRQNDPQYQSPLEGDSQRATQFGMGSQADVPLHQGAQDMGPGGNFIDPNTIQPGVEVYGTDGKKVGTIQEVYEDSFMVKKGIFFVHDYFIPRSYITRVTGDRVELGLTADEARSQDWTHRPPTSALGRGVQANPATDNQQSGLNTQNNVNPTGLGTTTPGGMGSTDPTYGAGNPTPNQMGRDQYSADRMSGDPYRGGNPADEPTREGAMSDDPYRSSALPADAVGGTSAQGAPEDSADDLGAPPRTPRDPDEWDPTQPGMTNP